LGRQWLDGVQQQAKPIRQFEPFFSNSHKFEFGIAVGVSSILFYDPAQRVVATLHPNHTFAKEIFDAWQQTSYDVNDTCAPRNLQTGDPRSDPDVSGFFAGFFDALPVVPGNPWRTWHALRISGALGVDERNAALRASAHADTPTTKHFDALGRAFLIQAPQQSGLRQS
jgi:hypothetical protein